MDPVGGSRWWRPPPGGKLVGLDTELHSALTVDIPGQVPRGITTAVCSGVRRRGTDPRHRHYRSRSATLPVPLP